MKRIKNAVCFLLTLLLVGLSLSLPVGAEAENSEEASQSEIHSIVVFGDSIAEGYGMPGFTAGHPEKAEGSFANLLAEHYGLTDNDGIHNWAKTGLDSKDILKTVKNADIDCLKNADMIVISAGSNDMINLLGEVVFQTYNSMAGELRESGITLDFSDLNALESALLSILSDSSKKELLQRFIQECTTQQVKTRCQDAVMKCGNNIQEMISYVREVGSQAEIFLLTPYNPTEAFLSNDLFALIQHSIEDIGKTYQEISQSREYGYRVNVVDLLSDFSGQYLELTNIASLDIHPSAAGHRQIADTIIRRMNILLKQHEAEIMTIRHRTAPIDNVYVYLLLAGAGLCVIAIIVYAVLLRRKK